MANIWEEFDKSIDTQALQEDVDKAAEGGNYTKPDTGVYEVSLDSMELAKSKTGNPMIKAAFTIKKGQFKGKKIFYNQTVHTGYGVKLHNDLLRAMDLDCVAEIEEDSKKLFQNFKQYGQLMLDVAEEVEEAKLTFELKYTNGGDSFDSFEITDVFEN